jgi:glutamate-1-semialdehyde 2,1-aminomutase
VVPHNDADAAENLFREHGSLIAGMIVDPIAGGRGLIPPADGFLMTLRRLCDEHGAVLIFDESVTGFRVAPGGAAALFEVMPDLICLGPALGGGLPLAAYGGRKDLMRLISSAWGVDHTIGASQANAVAIAAGIATLEAMSEPGFYEDLEAKSVRLDEGLRAAAAAAKAATSHSRAGSLIGMSFTSERVRSIDAADPNRWAARWTRYYHAMLDRGIFLPPAPTACICVSAAHTDDQIDQTIEMAHDVLRVIRAEGDE